jgi:hypothetical protein
MSVNATREEYEGWNNDERAEEIRKRAPIRTVLIRKRGTIRALVTKARDKWDTLFARIDPLTTGRSWTAQEYAIIDYQLKTLYESTRTLSDLNNSIMDLMPEGLYEDPALEAETDEIYVYDERKYQLVSVLEGYLAEQSKDNDAIRKRLSTAVAPATPGYSAFTTPVTGGLGTTAKIKYPALARPEFYGDIVEWPPFWDSWKINYDANHDLNEVQKLEYLKQCLKGSALETVKHLILIGTNYQVAMDTLEKKYSDKRKIIARHFDAIVAIPSIRTESATQLRKMTETFSVQLQGLRNQGITCDDPFVAYIYETRLDETTRRHYEASLADPKAVQTFKTLVDFVESRVVVLDNSSARSSLETGRTRHSHVDKKSNVGQTEDLAPAKAMTFKEFQNCQRGYHNDVQDGINKMMAAAKTHQSRALGRGRGRGRSTTPSTQRDPYRVRSVTPGDTRYGNNFRQGGGRGGSGWREQRDRSQSRDQSAPRVRLQDPVPPCSYCDACGHRTNQCSKFRNLSVPQRKTAASTKRLCFNCLDSGHSIRDCPSSYKCITCDQNHHSLLHGAASSANQTSKVTIHSTTPEKQTVVLATAQEPILDFDEDVVTLQGYVRFWLTVYVHNGKGVPWDPPEEKYLRRSGYWLRSAKVTERERLRQTSLKVR